ncbi:DNA-directed DNA polymerase I [Companilactobacillus paralimentarius DSM 13238 = JCM 10415]|jgi:DNA polymerase I|uniref:DNA polymerase I n=1 Tax=Companilactobacillus paralimentarius DSM 13238 = JCM 10415 TaxID=1122151 RepID=A0A0R1P6S7_9LACO|nr:DNA polymerase I [Companilactobacillus paralimentarius]KAE9561931.1 DNA polymerase I [Companilactobacillus paralimentarius]KRL28224.1 DNA-directed DNA polymerase I [Companilactobacillus paralimentarius DSM 13238 = JCM 10415]MDR4934382.1 DNA polymerase I [Companilactobacillus paralimentarius]QFR68617.1 DNA polymerase I [Companilactobacillus paralimentarius]
MSKNKKLLLIDGNSVSFRAFFAMHNVLDKFVNGEGIHTNALYAFNNMLEIILKDEKPTHALVAFDAGKTTFRTKMFDEYKGTRAKTPQELMEQLPLIQEMLNYRGIKTYELPDYEADDIIGTMSHKAEKDGMDVTIITGDRDLTQLATDKVTVKVNVKGVTETESYTPEHVQEKLGITPNQIIDMKGLMGDNSDHYPGVEKVGEKTAIKLINEYGSVEGIYDHVDEMKKSKLKEHLISDKDKAFLSKKLATIDLDAPVEIKLSDLEYHGDDEEQLMQFYQKMNFKTFLSRMDVPQENTAEDLADITVKPLDDEAVKTIVSDSKAHTLIVEGFGENYHTAPIIGILISDGKDFYGTTDFAILENKSLKNWLADKTKEKYLFDNKRTIALLHRYGCDLSGISFDMLLVSYLLDSNDNKQDIGLVAKNYNVNLPTEEEFYGKGVKKAVPEDEKLLLNFLAQKAQVIDNLKDQMLKELKDNDQDSLYDEIELPLSIVLAEMEIKGITVEVSKLKEMENTFATRLAEIEKTIYEEAGKEFNINSPKQLGVVLFEDLKLPVIKKTKTGYSTSVDVLEKLKDKSPVVQKVLDYRQISKIQSTYVVGLQKFVQPDNKIHTIYLQTLTQTGRLSSIEPNLQNIPIRIDEGKQIRKAFVPQHKDWEIFSADYSQVELRVLAHISGDEHMQEAFNEDYDIHAHTAMRIFGLNSTDEVTPNMRRQAKATNFGIVYGISDYGLSQNIGISRKQAAAFIESYFEQYPGVKKYMDDIVKYARENGYVETIMHRRRYLPDIHSKNFNVRNFAQRTAMNTPIQGSAADIIKVAMINMQKMLVKESLQANLLLQVHDEMIFEAPVSEIATLEKLVPSVMDSAVKLDVPLKVETAHGKTWYEAK